MLRFLEKWLGEWKTDEQLKIENALAYDAEMSRVSNELAKRRKVAIEQLGEKWLMHPANRVYRKSNFQNGKKV